MNHHHLLCTSYDRRAFLHELFYLPNKKINRRLIKKKKKKEIKSLTALPSFAPWRFRVFEFDEESLVAYVRL